MKKLKSLLFAALAVCGMTAAAEPFTVTVNVDDATRVRCLDGNNNEVPLVTGANTFEFESVNTDYEFRATDGNQIKSVTSESGAYVGYHTGSYWYCQFVGEDVFTVTTYNVEETRTASFICNVDAAEKVLLQRQDYTSVPLQNGENIVKFNPELETSFTLDKAYGYPQPYKVTKNGVDIPYTYGYQFSATDGDVIDIQTEYPDIDATITFSYNAGGEGCITNVRVNNELVSDFDGKSLTAKLGSTLTFDRADNWNVSSYTLNGNTTYYFYSYSGVVTGDMEFSFIANYDDPRVTVKLNVDDASHVEAKIAYSSTYFSLKDGDNEIAIDRYQTLEVNGVAPYSIKEVVDLESGYNESLNSGKWTKYIMSGTYNYKITTYNLEESRTATAIINVDDPTKVLFRRSSDYATIELKEGENILKFNPETETSFSVSSKSNAPLWSVNMNGEALTSLYGTYNLTLTDGCVVDVVATIPDIDITATFVINEEAKDVISAVKVNGQAVEFNGESVKMKAGQTIDLTFSSLYKIDSFKIGETIENIYGTSYNKLLMTDTVFTIEAHKLATFKITINVDDPENIKIGNGYSMYYDPTVFVLSAGKNEVDVPENNTNICWQINDGAELVSIYKNGEIFNSEYSSNMSVAEGDEITFTTTKIAYDKTAVCWIDNKEAASSYFSLSGGSSDRTQIKVETGYNVFNFREKMLPLNVAWYGESATVGKVYINNELVQPIYEGSTSHNLPIKEGDVIKVFLTEEPVECGVGFNVEDGFSVEAVADRITPVDVTKPLTVFAGTEVSFSVAGDGEYIVKNGDEEITADEDGKFTVTVAADMMLSVEAVIPAIVAVTLIVDDPEAIVVTNGEEILALTEGENAFELAVENATISWAATEGHEIVSVDYNGEAVTVESLELKEGDVVTFTTAFIQDGISEIENNQSGAEKVYDLQGRRLNKAGKGIFIINGRKAFVGK